MADHAITGIILTVLEVPMATETVRSETTQIAIALARSEAVLTAVAAVPLGAVLTVIAIVLLEAVLIAVEAVHLEVVPAAEEHAASEAVHVQVACLTAAEAHTPMEVEADRTLVATDKLHLQFENTNLCI